MNIVQPERKQWILARKDLNMPPGKLGAQVAHASMAALLLGSSIQALPHLTNTPTALVIPLDVDLEPWLSGRFTKVVLEVNSEEEMLDIYTRAIAEGFRASKIVDSGLTVFNGPTLTCVGLGAHLPEAVHHLVGHLQTYRLGKPKKT